MAGLTEMRRGSINRMRVDRLIELSSSGTRTEKIGTSSTIAIGMLASVGSAVRPLNNSTIEALLTAGHRSPRSYERDHSTRKVRRATTLPRVRVADSSPATATE
jgi:hypothetical protein